MADALHTCETGLLRGRGVTRSSLMAVGEQMIMDLIEPLEEAAATDSGPVDPS